MLFQSITFLAFFPVIAIVYFVTKAKWRWAWLLFASYVFYMYWNPWYFFLIAVSTLTDYAVSLKMERTSSPANRKKLLYLSIFINLGLLFTFKYFDFFSAQIEGLIRHVDPGFQSFYLDLLLPIGISFYTFQTMAYTIDVYRGDIKAERHLGRFALFVTFFPQLVAGPIERAKDLLSQFHFQFAPNYQRIVEGLRLMLWGFFKKLVIADQLGLLVTEVYDHAGSYSGWMIWIVAYAFFLQLYCDFSAYQDIAVGIARMLGIHLSKNFEDRVYFSTSITQFWRHWHMTLTRWIRDYIYIPLGGNRRGNWIRFRNIFLVLFATGLWHGSNWTYIFWGLINGGYLIAEYLFKQLKHPLAYKWGHASHWAIRFLKIVLSFHAICFAFIFFRAPSLSQGWQMLMASLAIDSQLLFPPTLLIKILPAIIGLVVMDLFIVLKRKSTIYQFMGNLPRIIRWLIYIGLGLAIALFRIPEEVQFIYFEF